MYYLIKNHQKWRKIPPEAGKCLGADFDTGRGVIQGDPASPMVFNIMVDAVVWTVFDVVCS